MAQSFLIYAPKIIFDLLFDIAYFLPWWYSKGLIKMFKSTGNFLIDKEHELAVFIWLKNIFKPLYENYGFFSMVKSFFKRIFQICFRSGILGFWVIGSVIKVVLYVVLPVLVVWQVIYQFLNF